MGRRFLATLVLAACGLAGLSGSAQAVVNCECMVGATHTQSAGHCRTVEYVCIDPMSIGMGFWCEPPNLPPSGVIFAVNVTVNGQSQDPVDLNRTNGIWQVAGYGHDCDSAEAGPR